MEKTSILFSKLQSLDISPTMYQEAVSHYKAMAATLDADNMKIYPQGSFALGTVVRPYREDEDQEFDLDLVCEVQEDKKAISPLDLRNNVKSSVEAHAKRLKKDVIEDDRCFTLEYAESGGIGFKLDIVPSVSEDQEGIDKIIHDGVDPERSRMAVSIVEVDSTRTRAKWKPSNPAGYAAWFNDINKRFGDFVKYAERERILREGKMCFASVQDVPPQLERSALQRVIQLLKRHQAVFYSRARKNNPTSAIITTLAAKAAQSAPTELNPYQLLKHVTERIALAKPLMESNFVAYSLAYQADLVITREGNLWKLPNPANPADNLTDSWSADDAKWFFKWLEVLKKDVLDETIYFSEESDIRRNVASALGLAYHEPEGDSGSGHSSNYGAPTIVRPVKPYRS